MNIEILSNINVLFSRGSQPLERTICWVYKANLAESRIQSPAAAQYKLTLFDLLIHSPNGCAGRCLPTTTDRFGSKAVICG